MSIAEIQPCRQKAAVEATLSVERAQIELAEPRRVGKDVDLGDLSAANRERHDRKRLSVERAHQAGSAIDEHWEPEQPEAREALRSARHLLCATVPDDIWNEASRHFNEAELGALLMSIALANLWNRLNVATRQVSGDWVAQYI